MIAKFSRITEVFIMNEILIEQVYWEQSDEFRNKYSLADFMLCFFLIYKTMDIFIRVFSKTENYSQCK